MTHPIDYEALIERLEALDNAPREHHRRPTIIHVDEAELKQAITAIRTLMEERGRLSSLEKIDSQLSDYILASSDETFAFQIGGVKKTYDDLKELHNKHNEEFYTADCRDLQ